MTDFRIHIPAAQVQDLRDRVDRTRWPDSVPGGDEEDWSWGTPAQVLRPLVERWAGAYDWSETQARWNELEQHLVEVDGQRIHLVRAGTRGADPLVLIHGWPDGFLRFEKALPLLADRFDLIVPSIPGYGFSDRPRSAGWGPSRVADAFVAALESLGITRFGVHGADLGSTVAEAMALRHPHRVVGLHLGDVPAWHRYAMDPATADAAEAAYLDGMAAWFAAEGAYAALQRTKPQTLGYALTDSPAGLAAWIVEKLRAWSDCGGDVLTRFTADEILDDLSLYWFTSTPASAVRYYRESALESPDPTARTRVPTGFTIFPRDIACAPQSYAERFFDVRRFTLATRGGHFGPWEEPQIWADDVRAFFDSVQ